VIRTARPLSLIVLLAALGLTLAACGGDDGGEEDPREVLEQTFSNDDPIEKGEIELQVEIAAEGGDQPGTLEGRFGGPFSVPEGKVPEFDLDVDIEAGGEQGEFTFEGGLASDGTSGFVNFQGTDYVVPQELLDQFASSFIQLQERGEGSQGSRCSLERLGISALDWITDLENEGTEDVEGVETTHIAGRGDTAALVADLEEIAGCQRANIPVDASQLDQLEETVESAEVDVYTGVDDRRLRRLSASFDLAPAPDTPGAPDSVAVDLVVTLSELDQEQTIEAPADAQPLRSLLEQLGIDPESIGGKGALRGGLGGLPQAGGPPAEPSDDASAAYLQCLQRARGPEAVQACAEELAQ
jgi:hypothetical protein